MKLETERTVLTPLVLDDEPDVGLLYKNEEVRRYLGGCVSEAAFSEKFERWLNAEDSFDFVVRTQDSIFIGLVNISPYEEKGGYEVSYQLLPSFWNNGYATEILELVFGFAFESLLLETLWAETQKRNLASVRLLKKLGMSFTTEVQRFGETQCIFTKSPVEI